MAFQETREQQQMYVMFRSCIYLFLVFEIIMNLPVPTEGKFVSFSVNIIKNFKVFNSVCSSKIAELVCMIVTCIGTTAKKEIEFDMKKMVIHPIYYGIMMTGLCFLFHYGAWGLTGFGIPLNRILYAIFSVLGIVFIHKGLDAIAKYYNSKMGKDRFNFENESFQQSEKLETNDYSVNIPMIYYFKKRMHKGWINIGNPFRGTIVLGTPGSGKSFGVIDPFIRQHSKKGFTMMVYDYKFPTLAKTLFYQYLKNSRLKRLPPNCGFKVVNFADVEYSHRVNPIQKKYIPDLAAASETAATLLASLNKGGGEKRGGSEAFFTNSAENFLAAIIYFFINLRPHGYKNGKRLKYYISYRGKKLRVKFEQRDVIVAVDEDDNDKMILDFINKEHKNCALEEDGLLADLSNLTYVDQQGYTVNIDKFWYENEQGNEVEPDTITGEFSDMAHVLAFLGHKYEDVFNILMQDDRIASLMAPFKTAFENKANDQLEGMVGTLRVNAAKLVSPEAYWVFTGDDFDLKISDKNNPCYLVIANDPEKEQVIGSLNALILNRLVTRVNSKGNVPCSIIVDELPTLYFHKIDRLIGTARSNKVAVTLGFQELPQLEADYGKVGSQKIISTCGNIFMGAARNKETLEWAQNDVFGKIKQTSHSVSISESGTNFSMSEHLDYLVPASKIADMATGWLAGQSARDFSPTDTSGSTFDIENSEDFKTSKYFCKTNFNMKEIANEEKHYVDIPKIYKFKSQRDKEIKLNKNFNRINKEVVDLIDNLLGRS